MRSQTTRDDETLAIASALALFLMVSAVGGLALWLVDMAVGWPGGATDVLFPALEAVAIVAALAVLVRHRRSRH